MDKLSWQRLYSNLSDATFRMTCESLRAEGGLPPQEMLTRLTLKNARFIARSWDQRWNETQLKKIAAEVAARIAKSFDPTKFRPAAKSSRKDRRARNLRLVEAGANALAKNQPLNIRSLAEQFDMSRSNAQRILSAAGISPRREMAVSDLSTLAQRLVSIVRQILPNDGRILFIQEKMASLIAFGVDWLSGGQEVLDAAIHEVEGARLGFRFYKLSDGFGAIVKGRDIEQDKMQAWASAKLQAGPSVFTPTEFPMKKTSETIIDLSAVLSVASNPSDPLALYRFFLASFDVPDPMSYRNAIHFASKGSGGEAVVERLQLAASTRPLQKAVLTALSIQVELMQRLWSNDVSPFGLLNGFLAQSKYLDRIGKGEFWNRDIRDVEIVLDWARGQDDVTDLKALVFSFDRLE